MRTDSPHAFLDPGFAAAVRPIAAQTQVATSAEGLEAGAIRVGEIPAYFARPQGSGTFPILVVVPEIFGLHEHIRDVCRRFAREGYLAIACEPYARYGDVTKLASIDEVRPIVAKASDAQVMADLDASVEWAVGQGGDRARLGVTGFCWGGRIAWLYAAHNPKVRAGVAWYGRVEGAASAQQPKHPIDLAADIRAPVLGLYGGADAGIPAEGVERFREALRRAGRPSEIHLYPGMPHAFFADYRPSYRAEAAHDGWRRALEWLRRHGVA